MKNLSLVIVLSFIFCLALVFVSKGELITTSIYQLASVIGIDPQSVHKYQTNRGIKRDLVIGDSGGDVMLVQQALNKLTPDFPKKNITGYFGEKTSLAVSRYQQDQKLPITGKIDLPTRNNLNDIYFKELCPDASGNNLSDEILVKVNRTKSLPKDYVPKNLTRVVDPVKTTSIICLKKEVLYYIEKMFQDALGQGVQLAITSGFRRPEIQGVIYKIWRSVLGERAKDSVAEPLHSEHQLGTTVDISGATNNFIGADDDFAGTPEDLWLRKNSYKYGFVMSYPEKKSHITGYVYEPWHYRFVGLEAAREIFTKNISVEEYFNLLDQK
jgi:D-alanyl-D-alanine carboxypeptidase